MKNAVSSAPSIARYIRASNGQLFPAIKKEKPNYSTQFRDDVNFQRAVFTEASIARERGYRVRREIAGTFSWLAFGAK